MANEHSIRVSARGEFGQLQRGLKQLQGDLKGVLGEIDKGARKGGIFDDTSLRALDVYRSRFKTTLEELTGEFKKQNDIIDRLHDKMKNASRQEQEDLRKQINLREKELDVIRRQLMEVERLYEKRNKEAQGFGNTPSGGGDGFGLPGAGLLKGLLAMGGMWTIGSLATQAYQGAYNARTAPMDLAQRIRGQEGWEGDSYSMWNRGYGIGTRDSMGYTAEETWQFHDQYSRQAGTLDENNMEHLLKFGRAYGLNTSELAGSMGAIRELGGATSPKHFADMIAGSVEQSGMQPRILEVMETSAGLLSEMNTTLKDTGAQQILAYQTTLDTLGQQNGMMKLTGKQGANIISGLGGIFDPQNDDWKFMQIRALQDYDPEKYKNMDLYGLERTFEDGLLNEDNLPAMFEYLRNESGGDTQSMKRMLQKWLQAGGYNATKTQVDQLYDVTDGGRALSEDNMKKVQETLDQGNATAPYEERQIEIGQQILDVNARFEKQLEELGQPLLEIITTLKEGFTGLGELLTKDNDLTGVVRDLSEFVKENWKTLATIGSILALGNMVLKGMSMIATAKTLFGKDKGKDGGDGDVEIDIPGAGKDKSGKGGFFKKLWRFIRNPTTLAVAGGAVMTGGALWASGRADEMSEEAWQKRKTALNEAGVSDEEIANSGLSKAQIMVGVADPEYAKWAMERAQNIDETMKAIEDGTFKGIEMTEEQTKVMQKYLQGVGEESKESLKRLEDKGTTHLEGVFNEHKGFKDFFGGLWTDFTAQVAGSMALVGGAVQMNGDLTSTIGDLIGASEGNYGSVNKNDNGAVSIGKLQWHGNRAKGLLQEIAKRDPQKWSEIMSMSQLRSDVENNRSFKNRTVNGAEAKMLQELLNTSVGQQVQDEFIQKDVSNYISKAQELGITDPKAIAFFADMYNQSPKSASMVARKSNRSLQGLYQTSLMNVSELGYENVLDEYSNRRKHAYDLSSSMDLTNRSLADVINYTTGQTPTVSGSGSSGTSKVEVTLKIEGSGAGSLNNATATQLKSLVKQAMEEIERQRLSMNPVTRGY